MCFQKYPDHPFHTPFEVPKTKAVHVSDHSWPCTKGQKLSTLQFSCFGGRRTRSHASCSTGAFINATLASAVSRFKSDREMLHQKGGIRLRVIFWARKIIWMFFSFMISIWFCYGFVMVSIWWKIWFCYGFKVLYQRDMIFNMIFVWCETASAKQNCECQSTQMWNKQTPICSFEKKTYTLFKVETRQKLKRKNASKSDIWSCFRDSGRCGLTVWMFFLFGIFRVEFSSHKNQGFFYWAIFGDIAYATGINLAFGPATWCNLFCCPDLYSGILFPVLGLIWHIIMFNLFHSSDVLHNTTSHCTCRGNTGMCSAFCTTGNAL